MTPTVLRDAGILCHTGINLLDNVVDLFGSHGGCIVSAGSCFLLCSCDDATMRLAGKRTAVLYQDSTSQNAVEFWQRPFSK